MRHTAYCYVELIVSSQAVAVLIATTQCTYPRRMARLSWPWMAGYIAKQYTGKRSPISVLTGLNVQKLLDCVQRRYT